MAIEDIIWAKNRHMFGGIAPSNMALFKAEVYINNYYPDGSLVQVFGYAPYPTVVNGQTLCTVGGVAIVKNPDRYPINEFDGEQLTLEPGHPRSDGWFYVADYIEPGQTMYYAAFPYSKQGVYNRSNNARNRAAVNATNAPGGTYLFGYDLDTANENTVERVTYITEDSIDNTNYTPATLNNLNSWNITPGEKFMPRPCMLKYDGTVDYYLDPNDYSKKEDGTDSDITNAAYEGNAMMEWPKIYTKRWEENGIYHFRCSDVKIDDDYECWCNYDSNDNEINHFYTAIYRSSQISVGGITRHRSLSGYNANSVVKNNGFSTDKALARTDSGWDMERFIDHLLIQDLLVMMGCNTNTQTVFGVGRNMGPTNSLSTGTADVEGLFYGKMNDDATITSLKIFGMEDYWGDYARRTPDLVTREGSVFAKIPTITDNTVSIASFGDGYTLVGKFTSDLNGYISKMTTYPWGRLPAETRGSNTTYECDKAYIGVSANTYIPALIGGGVGSGLTLDERGAFTCMFSNITAATWLGSRLSYKPTASV